MCIREEKIIQYIRSSHQWVLFLHSQVSLTQYINSKKRKKMIVRQRQMIFHNTINVRRDNSIFAADGYRWTHCGQHLFPAYANLINGCTETRLWCVHDICVCVHANASNGVFITVQSPRDSLSISPFFFFFIIHEAFKIPIFDNYISHIQLHIKKHALLYRI